MINLCQNESFFKITGKENKSRLPLASVLSAYHKLNAIQSCDWNVPYLSPSSILAGGQNSPKGRVWPYGFGVDLQYQSNFSFGWLCFLPISDKTALTKRH